MSAFKKGKAVSFRARRHDPPKGEKKRYLLVFITMPKPIVLSIRGGFKPRERSLMDYRGIEINHHVGKVVDDAKLALSDHDIKILLVWSLIFAGAALSYLIWVRYPRLRPLAAIVFTLSLFQFAGQFGGIYFLFAKLGLWPAG